MVPEPSPRWQCARRMRRFLHACARQKLPSSEAANWPQRSGAPRASRPIVIWSHEDDLQRRGRDAAADFASTFGAGAAPGDGQEGLRVWVERLRARPTMAREFEAKTCAAAGARRSHELAH